MSVISMEQAEVLIRGLQWEVRDLNTRLVAVEKEAKVGAVVTDHSVELDRHTDLMYEIKQQTDKIGAPPDTDRTVWSRLDEHEALLQTISSTVDRHTSILREHGMKLDAYGAKLEEHGAILREHSETLREHGEMLREHGVLLQKILAKLS